MVKENIKNPNFIEKKFLEMTREEKVEEHRRLIKIGMILYGITIPTLVMVTVSFI